MKADGQVGEIGIDRSQNHPDGTQALCEVVNALMNVSDNGIQWRSMPHDFPAWQAVYGYFRGWRQQGGWEQVNQALTRQVRLDAGQAAQPS